MRSTVPAFAFLLALSHAGCGGSGASANGGGVAEPVTALFDNSPDRDDFFALPWPSDDRVQTFADGSKHLDMSGFHYTGALIGEYLTLFHSQPTTGYGTSSAIFFRFDGPIDPSTLPPTSLDSVAAASSVFVIDVTPASPTFGQRAPVRAHFNHDSGSYIGPDSLALLPEPGFPLRQSTTYAAVITDSVKGTDGWPVRRDPRFPGPAAGLGLGVDASHVVASTVFTTADVTTIMKELRDAVYAQAPTPVSADLKLVATRSRYDLYEGTYDAPNYQEGDPPYLNVGGQIHLGADGKPLAVRTENLRVAMTIPLGEMPKAGWPVVLYAHGTGGDFESFVDDNSGYYAALAVDGSGNTIAKMAMISIDQVLHGPRDPTGSDPDITFYNFENLLAARDNIKQGALDDFSLLRFVEAMNVSAAPGTGVPIQFDPDRIYFKGHSQGGSTGPLFLAFEPNVKAAILSGAGAVLELALLSKTQPLDIPSLVSALIGEPIDEYHPLLNMMQMFLDSADPNNYARYFFREPPAGLAPKSIYQSLGIVDHYTPIPTIKALALAMGVQPATPQIQTIDALALTTQTWAPPPLMNNVAKGAAGGVLCEYQVPTPSVGDQPYDGHFVVFDDPDAIRQSNAFLATHAATGVAQLIP